MVAVGATKVCTCNYAMESAFAKDDTTMTKTKTNDAVVEYTIYTDGAYSNLHQEGAFVFIMLKGDKEIMRMGGKIKNEDCNRAEIKAIIAGVSKLPVDAGRVNIISDSMTALKTLARRIPNVKNMDLLAISKLSTPALMPLLKRLGSGLRIIYYLQINKVSHVYILNNSKNI